ncbi:OLC1v1035410C1 [Oldenlandia corymbosa var. corymbosa]|uniref:OLC1v1035410C1 n=1 Tax=Oldenlandia corymbosa var. corymbosa TaxID=529605 RepID=A0AAV1CSX2_OLDCO|nr:OLC1v1035410C1 [Oldenlandia corymbosa var. corymbosa]
MEFDGVKSMKTMQKRSHALSFSHNFPVKLEVAAAAAAAEERQYGHDSLDGGYGYYGRVSKRSRLSPSSSSSLSSLFQLQRWSSGGHEFSAESSQHNPLAEPSPLGLRLRKSPSLLDLIQMRLSGSNALPVAAAPVEVPSNGIKKDVKTSSASDKMKASNFLASSLRIGGWEFVSKHEGDLVAKCYFAKKKLVWEVLEGGLKSKIEIQWSDIIGLKANCPDDAPGTLTVVLARQPLFFRETNPQPRKHTLWQSSSDFTGGQASIHRQHIVQCPPGMLSKHFEKLILSEPRLNFLNQQNEFMVESICFDSQASVQENPDQNSIELHNGEVSPVSCFRDGASPSLSELSSLNYESGSVNLWKGIPSPSSVMDANAIEGSQGSQSDIQTLKNLEQYKVTGIRPSISLSDLVNHIGNQISERVTSGNMPSEKASECHEMLENVAQMLLSDTQNDAASDEKLMKKVNSLCCLIQDPVASVNSLDPLTEGSNAEDFEWEIKAADDGISRNDSFGDLFLHFPRTASFQKFLCDIDETEENQN